MPICPNDAPDNANIAIAHNIGANNIERRNRLAIIFPLGLRDPRLPERLLLRAQRSNGGDFDERRAQQLSRGLMSAFASLGEKARAMPRGFSGGTKLGNHQCKLPLLQRLG
jgi:hypothetical protein